MGGLDAHGAATTTTITGLTASTEYQVQVRALNGETPSAWSDPSDAVSTNSVTNNAPVFSETAPTRVVPENLASGQNVGDAVTADDADPGDTLNTPWKAPTRRRSTSSRLPARSRPHPE